MGIGEATTTAIAGVSLGAVGVVVGQVEVPDAPNWLNTLGGLTSLGFAVWYAWYVTTRTIPERDKTHAETISGLVSEFREEQKETRAANEKTMERQATAFEKAVHK